METFFSGLRYYLGWRVISGKLIYHCYSCLDSSVLWTLHFTMYYQLCNPKVDVVLPDWRLESEGAIYPYKWCSYYELRASREGNEGGNRQNRLHLESRTPSCSGLWTLSYMPRTMEIAYQLENQTPTRPHPQPMEQPQSSYLDSPSPKRIPQLSV